MNFALFLTDYASYNEGRQFEFGHWVDLEEFDSAEDFLEYVCKHLEEADKKSPLLCSTREEPMFTDYEGIPYDLYGECLSLPDLEKIYAYIELANEFDLHCPHTLMQLHNERCQEECNGEGYIYQIEESTLEGLFSTKLEALRAGIHGDFSMHHDYFIFDGYANLKSFSESRLSHFIDKDKIIDFKLNQVM